MTIQPQTNGTNPTINAVLQKHIAPHSELLQALQSCRWEAVAVPNDQQESALQVPSGGFFQTSFSLLNRTITGKLQIPPNTPGGAQEYTINMQQQAALSSNLAIPVVSFLVSLRLAEQELGRSLDANDLVTTLGLRFSLPSYKEFAIGNNIESGWLRKIDDVPEHLVCQEPHACGFLGTVVYKLEPTTYSLPSQSLDDSAMARMGSGRAGPCQLN